MQQRFRLLRRVGFLALCIAQALAAGAERHQPVAAHLQIFVQPLHRVVIEGVARLRPLAAQIIVSWALVKRRPRKLGIGLDLTPDHVIQQPIIQILQDCAHAEDIVIAADHPDRAVILRIRRAAVSQSLVKLS